MSIKVSDYVIKYLEDYGIKHIFLLPGGGCIHLIDSLGKSEKIKIVANLHEQGAGICAEAYAQYNNKLGVAIVTTGPGATNIVTAVAAAYLESTPLLVIGGQVQMKDMKQSMCNDPIHNKSIRQKGFQEVDNRTIMKSITKDSDVVFYAGDIKFKLDMAISCATSGRPGPVFLEIPLDIQSQMIDENNIDYCNSIPNICENESNYPILLNHISNSSKPIILLGNGVRLSNAQEEFYKFIEHLNIPVLTTWKAIDLLEDTHPLYVGRPGTIAQRGANISLQSADLIICLGARLDSGQIAYQQKYFGHNNKKIIIDIDNFELKKLDGMKNAELILADVKKVLNNENEIMETQPYYEKDTFFINEPTITKFNTKIKPWLDECRKRYLDMHPMMEYYLYNTTEKTPNTIDMYVFMNKLNNLFFKENDVVIPGSSGICSEVVMQTICIKNGMRVYNTQGLGAMGFGVPASIGGALASKDKRIICIDGDGGFFMNFQELELINRYKLKITYFILNNDGYASIRNTQNNYFNGFKVASDAESGLTLPNIQKTAQLFNIKYSKIDSMESMENFLLHNNDNESHIVEVMINPNHVTLPRTITTLNENGKFESSPMEILFPEMPNYIEVSNSADNMIDRFDIHIGNNQKKDLPENILHFFSRHTPIVNVDILIRNYKGELLLKKRQKENCVYVWHVPGGIIRYKEPIIERMCKVGVNEIGININDYKYRYKETNEIIVDNKDGNRNHFISLLYEIYIPTEKALHDLNEKLLEFDIAALNKQYNIPTSDGLPYDLIEGHLTWFKECPPNFIECQKNAYSKYFNCVYKKRYKEGK